MTERDEVAQLAEILNDAERVDGAVTRKTGGDDADWAPLHAWCLVRWPGIDRVLDLVPGIARLTVELVRFDAAFRSETPGATWPAFDARTMLATDGRKGAR